APGAQRWTGLAAPAAPPNPWTAAPISPGLRKRDQRVRCLDATPRYDDGPTVGWRGPAFATAVRAPCPGDDIGARPTQIPIDEQAPKLPSSPSVRDPNRRNSRIQK